MRSAQPRSAKGQSQGRDEWAVIFRHPVRLDGTGKPGRRVRRGLGTNDEGLATQLTAELNKIIQRPELWEPAARMGLLTTRFDERVLEIFYDGMEPSAHDPETLRNDILPLPDHAAGYRSVLMLGTTEAGKTTLVRQLLGTDPPPRSTGVPGPTPPWDTDNNSDALAPVET